MATVTRTVVAGTATRLQATVTTTALPSALKQHEGIGLGVALALGTTVVVFIFCFICIPAFRRAIKQIFYGNVAINSQNVKQGILSEEDLEQQEEAGEQLEDGREQPEVGGEQLEDGQATEAERLLRCVDSKFFRHYKLYSNKINCLSNDSNTPETDLRPSSR